MFNTELTPHNLLMGDNFWLVLQLQNGSRMHAMHKDEMGLQVECNVREEGYVQRQPLLGGFSGAVGELLQELDCRSLWRLHQFEHRPILQKQSVLPKTRKDT